MGSMDFSSLVDAERGVIDRSVFSDPAIYELELERHLRALLALCRP